MTCLPCRISKPLQSILDVPPPAVRRKGIRMGRRTCVNETVVHAIRPSGPDSSIDPTPHWDATQFLTMYNAIGDDGESGVLSDSTHRSRDGGTGRRSGLKIRRPLRPWGFDPPSRHQKTKIFRLNWPLETGEANIVWWLFWWLLVATDGHIATKKPTKIGIPSNFAECIKLKSSFQTADLDLRRLRRTAHSLPHPSQQHRDADRQLDHTFYDSV